jgi:response regulator RpfG family c-di-GMP phosphodiesterase
MSGDPTFSSPTASKPTLPRILCVDDEPNILSALRRQLRRKYTVTVTDTPDQALDILESHSFEVIISDERMPGMPGHEFLAKAKLRAPDAMRILLTGQADPADVASALNDSGIFKYLQKPWSDSDLQSSIDDALNHRARVISAREGRVKTEAQNFRFAEYNRKLAQQMQRAESERTQAEQALRELSAASVAGLFEVLAWSDAVLADHCRRVAEMTTSLGEILGIPESEIEEARLAALVHDIGKLKVGECKGVDPEVQAEHAASGSDLIRKLPGIETLAQAVHHHHERFDGKGFPDGLSGSDIPIGSRLIAVASAFDRALAQGDKKVALSKSEAIEAVEKGSSRHFDPEIVAALAQHVGKDEWQRTDAIGASDVLDLVPGMILAKTLRTKEGMVVAGEGHVLRESDIERIRKLAKSKSIASTVTLKFKA